MAEDDTTILINRFAELAQRAEKTGVPQSTRFLSLAEQSTLQTLYFPVPYFLFGGYDGAERRIAIFGAGDREECESLDFAPPVVCVAVSPASMRFADELGHRDFLGSLMALGITREVLGDILIKGNVGYLFCLDTIADYVIGELTSVKRTTVRCAYAEAPETDETERAAQSIVVASERLDALISAVCRVSREEAKLLVEKGLVFIDGRLALKPALQLGGNEIVSVRGKGRFKFLGVERETKKGKLRVEVIKY